MIPGINTFSGKILSVIKTLNKDFSSSQIHGAKSYGHQLFVNCFLSVMLSKVVWISWLFLCIAYIAYQHKSEFWFFMLPRAIGFYMSYAYCTCMSLCSFFQLCFRSHMFREINAARKQLLHSCWVVGSSPELGYKYGVSFFLGC